MPIEVRADASVGDLKEAILIAAQLPHSSDDQKRVELLYAGKELKDRDVLLSETGICAQSRVEWSSKPAPYRRPRARNNDNFDKVRKCMDCMACIGSGNKRQKRKKRVIRCTQCCCAIGCAYCCTPIGPYATADSVFSLTPMSTCPEWVKDVVAMAPYWCSEQFANCISDEEYCHESCRCSCQEKSVRCYQQCCSAVINDGLVDRCGYYPEMEEEVDGDAEQHPLLQGMAMT